MKTAPLSTETIGDILPFIIGHSIDFEYDAGKCVKIIGKDNDNVVMSVGLEYKEGNLTDINIESTHIKLPNGANFNMQINAPGVGQFRFLRDGSYLRSIDASLTLFASDKIYDWAMHRDYQYDDFGNLIQVIQNGETVRKLTYRDNLLILDKCLVGEIKYIYDDKNLIIGNILVKKGRIIIRRAFEYTDDNKVAREFIIHPDGKWYLRALHIHNFTFDDIKETSINDTVPRFFYDNQGRLIMKIKINDDAIRGKGFKFSRILQNIRNKDDLNFQNLDIFIMDQKGKFVFMLRKQDGRVIVCQLLHYTVNGFLKTIETSPDSYFDKKCFLSLRHLTCNDILF